MGSKRSCYVHPSNHNLCIKVISNTCNKHDGIVAQQLEVDDYSVLQRCERSALFDRIPRFEGTVETDLGLGIVSQLLRDVDGEISQNLAKLLQKQGLTPDLVKAIDKLKQWLQENLSVAGWQKVKAIDKLKQWLHEQHLLTRDTGPHNIVAMRVANSKWHLVIIEGWINRKFRWLHCRSTHLATYLINRQLRKFDRRMEYLITTK